MEENVVLVEDRAVADGAHYRAITLNRPQRLNAFIAPMHHALRSALVEAERDSACRAILLTGAGRGFCAGQDLSERNVDGAPLDLGETTRTYYNPLVKRLASLRIPTLCAVGGTAAGAGVNLALACDIVVARVSAKFVQAFSSIGLAPDAGGSYWLPRMIGQSRALGFTLLGQSVSARQAEIWGLIWKAIDDDRFDEEVEALLTQLAGAATRGLHAAKTAIRAAARNTLEQQLELESASQFECGRTRDYKEGVTAFKERRPPRFTGR
jgi:2-(1,2-epoxy-1,2-dihydrophenyl)acetyl-CoA isomerase